MDPRINVLTFETLVGMAINKASNDIKTLVEESGLDEESIQRFEAEVSKYESIGFMFVAPVEYQATMRELPKVKKWIAVLREIFALGPLPRQEIRFLGKEDEDEQQATKIVCLCGSTRFWKTHNAANEIETAKGNIVLSSGVNLKDRQCKRRLEARGFDTDERMKEALDELHRRKIEMADEILVIDEDGYVGDSTREEIAFAEQCGKRVRYWSQEQEAADRANNRGSE